MRFLSKPVGVGLGLGLLILTVAPTFAQANTGTFDNNHEYVTKFKVYLDCRVQVGFTYLRQPASKGYAFARWDATPKKSFDLGEVTSRENPTASELAAIAEKKAQCQEWLDEAIPKAREKLCKRWNNLKEWQRWDTELGVFSANRPLELVTMNTGGHPPYRYAVPPGESYYNQLRGTQGNDPVNPFTDC